MKVMGLRLSYPFRMLPIVLFDKPDRLAERVVAEAAVGDRRSQIVHVGQQGVRDERLWLDPPGFGLADQLDGEDIE